MQNDGNLFRCDHHDYVGIFSKEVEDETLI